MDKEQIMSLNCNQLKAKLAELNLKITGRKSTLQDRLLENFNLEVDEDDSDENSDTTVRQNKSANQIDDEEESSHDEDETGDANKKTTNEASSIFTLRDIRESLNFFDGNGQPEIEDWIEEFEDNATSVGWNKLQKFIYAKQLIKGAAKTFVRSKKQITDWSKLKKALKEEFGQQISAAEIHQKLRNRRKRFNETYLDYLYTLMDISSTLPNIDEKSLIIYFADGISDSPQNKSILYDAQNIRELKNKIKTYERTKQQKLNFNRNYNTQKITGNTNKTCTRCPHLNNHVTEECKKLNYTCFKCNQKGHLANNCQSTTGAQATNQQRTNRRFINNRTNAGYRPFSNTTPNQLPVNQNNAANRQQDSQNINSLVCQIKPNLNIIVTINKISIEALFDTGSDLSFLLRSDYEKLNGVILFTNKVKVRSAGQGSFDTIGYIITRVTVNEQTFVWKFYIVNNNDLLSQSIIGNDILSVLNVNIAEGGIQFFLKEEQPPLENFLFFELSQRSNEECNNDPWAEMEFQALCMDRSIEENLNINLDHLHKHNKDKVINLVKDYKITNNKRPNIDMKIILTDEIPIYHKPRRISLQDQRIVEAQIEDWLENDIIRPSHSEYASPIVLAQKKDGTKRLCCDYRKVNKKMIRDNFPMVLIDDALSKLNKAKVFTTLDLKNGFFHVPMNANSIKYTSFVTHRGQYEFLKVPFGLANSPAVFCRYINAVFNELILDGTIIIYIDDIVIPAQTVEQNLNQLIKVLNVASEYGLQINWKKCQFLTTEISFLGYVIKNSSIQPSREKTKAISNFPQPNDIVKLQQFLGLTSYFRRFIRNYATIAKPLTDLLCKDAQFKFQEEQIIAFEQLKSSLSDSPVLKIYNPQAETEVHTDASKYGLGAVLLQKDAEDATWHPVEYMSRKTLQCQQKYHSYDLEVLAVITALKKWKVYLLGIKFKIVTDCVAFTQTVDKPDVPARITRWIIFLQDFEYEIEHRPATKLKHVDALSRVYCYMLNSSLKHRISQAQDNDIWTKNLKELVKANGHTDFYVKNDILFKNHEKELLVIPESMENEIIDTAHKQGHFSVIKTIDLIQKTFFIRNISEKAKKIVQNCIQCLITNAKAGKKEGLLNPIEKSSYPLDTYHIDHVGPLEQTNKNYNYILTIVDSFSKFIWLYATKSTGANEVVQSLQKQSVIFGNPKRIVSDRGAAFTSQAFKEYCKGENITHVITTTGVPRGNGQVERMHKIVISLLTKLCAESPGKWYKHIGKIQQTINNTPSRSTRETPFRILTGIPMKLNNNLILKELLTEEEIEFLDSERDNIRVKAKENILKIQQENVKTFNKNRKKEKEYKVGDLVAILRTQFGTRLKIKPKFLGPYRITKKKSNGRYEVERIAEFEGPKKTTTIAENMKLWN